MQSRFFILPACLMAAACAPQAPTPEPAPNPQPPVTPAPPAPQQPTGKWTDWPITPGDWVYRQDARGSIALFGAAGQDALLTLRCDKARGRIYLSRKSDKPSARMAIRTSARLKNANASSAGGSPAYLAIEMMPQDPILPAIAYSRGRIAIETDGEISMAVPVYSEMARVIEDCL